MILSLCVHASVWDTAGVQDPISLESAGLQARLDQVARRKLSSVTEKQ